MDGLLDGCTVGCRIGCLEGCAVGFDKGCRVGCLEGCAVGWVEGFVGDQLGLPDGLDALRVGKDVGILGSEDGRLEG